MTRNDLRRSPISRVQLAAALAAIVVATAVLPPAAAWSLNQTRIAQTRARAHAAAERLRARANEFSGAGGRIGIACGPGRLPDAMPSTATARAAAASLSTHQDWRRGAQAAPELFGPGMPTDAWGRCFLFNVDAWASDGPVWLLSAGPNGLIDTPTDAPSLAGDDIGDRVR